MRVRFPRASYSIVVHAPPGAVTLGSSGLNGGLDYSCPSWRAPNAKYLHYEFTFAHPRASTQHVSKRRYTGETEGNYPRAILIRGYLIAAAGRSRDS
jgi:hypothetical protein